MFGKIVPVRNFFSTFFLALVLSLSLHPSAEAFPSLSVMGGASVGSGEAHRDWQQGSFLLGTELGWEFIGGYITLGGFLDYDPMSLQGGDSGSLIFFGPFLRLKAGRFTAPFVDARAGWSQESRPSVNSGFSLGYGFGLGYQVMLGPTADIKPRAGIRILPTDLGAGPTNRTMIDIGLLLTLYFG